uniref:Uncharacterized protein n=1 Tax=Kalanchoe fedtschenkoi TaxID=63787 RepID=A0A7N0VBL2_KALFE
MYEKNPEECVPAAMVPDEVVNGSRSGKYWVPHPETGVFMPLLAEENSNCVSRAVISDGRKKTAPEEKAWFRPTGLEDLDKPLC